MLGKEPSTNARILPLDIMGGKPCNRGCGCGATLVVIKFLSAQLRVVATSSALIAKIRLRIKSFAHCFTDKIYQQQGYPEFRTIFARRTDITGFLPPSEALHLHKFLAVI